MVVYNYMTDPEISIVIVSWNVRDLLIACLQSLTRYVTSSHEIIVVDNHSSDGTIEAVRNQFPHVTIIANQSNAGFSRANNQGWLKSRGQFICFLNPDTVVASNPFTSLVNYLRSNPDVGMVGPKLLNDDGTHQLSVRSFPQFIDQALVLLKLRWLGKLLPPIKQYQYPVTATSPDPVNVDQLMGACIVIPRTVLTDGGSFDEGYWIWFEEVDLCRRLKDKGYAITYYPLVHIQHLGGKSFVQHISMMKHIWFMKSLSRYANKYWSLSARIGIIMIMPMSYVLTFVMSLFKPK